MKTTKLQKANEIVKKFVSDNFKRPHYAYIDFVEEDRFLTEIVGDKNVDIEKDTPEELAEYAIEQISKGCNMANLLGF